MLAKFSLVTFVVLAFSSPASAADHLVKRVALVSPPPPPPPHTGVPDYHINRLMKRDKSPNPARKTYSGCRARKSLCSGSHADSDIQMGECWSNARTMGQKTAIFEPFQPGHKSYDSEGGPYGTCTAYPCYPSESDLESTSNLANLCFFWDGTDSTKTGLNRRDGDEDDDKIKDSNDVVARNQTVKANTRSTMPSAPGQAIVPMPMVCPHNLNNCYSSSYFEPGGKLAAFADAKPTYKGVWFPPKSKDGKALFCHGLELGCQTPTMSQLQTARLSSAGCDVPKCQSRS